MSEKATLLTSIPPVKKNLSVESNAQTSNSNEAKTDTVDTVGTVDTSGKANTLLKIKSTSNESVTSGDVVNTSPTLLSPTLLSTTPAQPKASESTSGDESEGKVSLLSQARVEAVKKEPAESPVLELIPSTKSASSANQGTDTTLNVAETVSSTVASEGVQEGVQENLGSISSFQVLTYASFVLNFLLAGAAAVILYKKAAKLVEERFAVCTKVFALAGVLIMLHGFFATYLYGLYVNGSVDSAPLFLTMAVWILVGPAVGFITRNLLARQQNPNRKAALIDAGIYGVIFFLATCGLSSGIKTNAALFASLLAGFLMIVPIARSLTAFRVARARHKELNETSVQILIYGLLLLPALLPILAFAHVCGLGDSVTLFLINFITFDFVLLVGLAMIASANEFTPAEDAETKAAGAEVVDEALTYQAAQTESYYDESDESALEPTPLIAETPFIPKPMPEQVGAGNSDDPIIQFLNSEEGMADKSAPKPAATSTPRSLTPRKLNKLGVKPPSKPNKPGSTSPEKAPNAPSSLRAPAKPKKRF